MTQSPGAVSPGGTVAERDALLATKLHLPRVRPGFVPRPRLLERLDDASAHALVLVCAPAGFGKTSLLSDWVRRGGRRVAWLSLDAEDSDPARFWRHAVAAVDHALPGIGDRLTPWLAPPAPPSFDGVVAALINELAADPPDDEVRLVLDDYHLVGSPAVHASLTFLLDHLPPELRLVLSSRADPPLHLARLRVRGQLGELRAADLRFTSEEASAVLHEAAGPGVPESAVSALEARTEGWAAGLQLAGLSIRGQADAAAFVATFSGSHRHILDYLTEEVLERQTDEVRRFLLETSVLERLSGPLCDAVTGRSGGQAMLEAVEGAGLFLVPLDEARGWWRYHQLFADLLRARLQQQCPEWVAMLHRRAAEWHEQQALADDAIRHALSADDTVWAARLIETQFDELFYLRGEGATVRRWLAALPDDVVQARRRLLVAQAAMADASGQFEAVEPLLSAAEQAAASSGDEAFAPSAGEAASLLVNVPATIAIFRSYLAQLHGDVSAAAALAARAREVIGAGEQMLGFISEGTSAVVEWSQGRARDAEHALSSAIARWRAAGHHNLIGWGGYHLGRVQQALGHLGAAEQTYRRVLESTAVPDGPTFPAAGIGYAGQADVAYQRGQLVEATRLVVEGIALCRQFTFTPPLSGALVRLAWIKHAEGDDAGAREAIDEALSIAPADTDADLLNPVPAQRARLLLAQGDVTSTERWTRERGLDPDREPEYHQELAYLVLARLLLAQDRPEEALPLLVRMDALATGQHRLGSVIELRALRALALARCDEAAAVDTLAEVLVLAGAEGHIRVFADEGEPMRALLGRVIVAQRSEHAAARTVPLDLLARLQRAFEERPERNAARTATALPGLIDRLTRREIEVLDLLAAGRSNRLIAEELVVTLDTVKKHVSHVLDKLGAANRTEAVARGRQLGLIA